MILDAAHNSIGVWVLGLHFALYEADTHFEFALAWEDQEDVGGVQHREDEVEDEADKEELSHLTNISLEQVASHNYISCKNPKTDLDRPIQPWPRPWT